jgi:hypothetical protein
MAPQLTSAAYSLTNLPHALAENVHLASHDEEIALEQSLAARCAAAVEESRASAVDQLVQVVRVSVTRIEAEGIGVRAGNDAEHTDKSNAATAVVVMTGDSVGRETLAAVDL